MKILLIAGHLHNTVLGYLQEQGIEVANREQILLEQALSYLVNCKQQFDKVFVIDEGIYLGESQSILWTAFISFLKQNYDDNLPILLLTRDHGLAESLKTKGVKVLSYNQLRIPMSVYQLVGIQLGRQAESKTSSSTRGISFFQRFRQKLAKPEHELEPTDQLTKQIDSISKSISRVIIITGHRGLGLTSTAVNTAVTANARGLSTILVDMDVDYRGTNMYFGSFSVLAQQDEELGGALVRCLARPQDITTTAFNIKDGLWLATLAYTFNDTRLLEQFYTCNKFISMISVLRQKFNTVIVDMPLDLLTRFQESLIHVDAFGLCVPNNLHAILSTLQNAQKRLDTDKIMYLNAKSKIVVTKYNSQSRFRGEVFAPDQVSQILASDLSDSFKLAMPVAGTIPYSAEFDLQIESDIPIVNQSEMYEKAYAQTLLRLMEGVK